MKPRQKKTVKNKFFKFRVSAEQKEKLKELARRQKMSVAKLILSKTLEGVKDVVK